ncbi:hypothetical protein GWK47_019237 [Chionoecetes opilio]|uniref:Uncharacterized protein n=1 Tax=Chionoecetes opilio TaxID=41210 RepID=A0A8J4XUM2_CHIOP|nr:hypothetical protein GWK47_019237 [Chionoecetes opilio]
MKGPVDLRQPPKLDVHRWGVPKQKLNIGIPGRERWGRWGAQRRGRTGGREEPCRGEYAQLRIRRNLTLRGPGDEGSQIPSEESDTARLTEEGACQHQEGPQERHGPRAPWCALTGNKNRASVSGTKLREPGAGRRTSAPSGSSGPTLPPYPSYAKAAHRLPLTTTAQGGDSLTPSSVVRSLPSSTAHTDGRLIPPNPQTPHLASTTPRQWGASHPPPGCGSMPRGDALRPRGTEAARWESSQGGGRGETTFHTARNDRHEFRDISQRDNYFRTIVIENAQHQLRTCAKYEDMNAEIQSSLRENGLKRALQNVCK